MFFILSKIFSFFLSPFSWILLLFFLALFIKKPEWKKRFLGSAFFILVFFGNNIVFQEVTRLWEMRAVKTVNENYDVAIVLGGFSNYDFTLERISFRNGADRLLQALPLYFSGKTKKILVSGGSGYILMPEMKESIFVKKYLESIQFPVEDLIIESDSRNTYENAKFTKVILDSLELSDKKILLITSAYHMRRSKACFDKAGLNCDLYCTDILADPNRHYILTDYFIPSINVLVAWDILIHEFVGYISYKFSGYI
jgi:uncharacterized SAM-binding protein YcdF (DUF218 family)